MNARRLKKTKLLPVIFIVALALVVCSIMPTTALAAPGDMTIEYRYLEGETVNVPATITQLNREYQLIAQAAPVRESELPVTRTYTYEIDGALSDEDLKLAASMPGLTLERRQENLEREAEKVVTVPDLPSNDVSRLPADKAPETMPCDTGMGTLQRSGIEFEVTATDGRGLPSKYSAKIIYRGIEIYPGDVYYAAEATYQTTVQEDATDQYVIVATYRPVVQPTQVIIVPPETVEEVAEEIPDDEVPLAEAPGEGETVAEVIPEDEVPLAQDAQGGEEADANAETIDDAEVPLASADDASDADSSNNTLWIILGIVAIAVAGLLIFFFVRKKKAGKANV